ncbi:MAG: hypothetical protein QOJ34_3221 [Pseudonocardiales bacterium]|nr:hypothetical protein [Pseudonocardiales bacterium]
MTSARPDAGGGGGPGPLDNGLRAAAYVPLTDVATEVGRHLLTALGRARIAAYLGPVPTGADEQSRLFVAAEERVDARTIVAAAVRALGADEPDLPANDPLAGVDTNSEFDALVADWKIDTVAAIRDAERDLTREDADWRSRLLKPQNTDEVWLDEDHYIPPPPPPLPRLAAPTIMAMAVLAISILLLGLGGEFGLAGRFTLILGLAGLLLGGVILFTRIRDFRRDDDEDDGAAI